MSLNSLKSDFETMLKLSRELGKLNEMLSHYNDINDKRNYNEEICKAILVELGKVHEEFTFLKKKWFGEN